MACTSAGIADWVTGWINDPARSWRVPGWTATRTWAPTTDLTALAAATITLPLVEVVPDSAEPEVPDTRDSEEVDWTIYIVVRQKYATSGSAAVPNSFVDPLAETCEQIADRIRGQAVTISGVTNLKATVFDTRIDPLVDPVELRDRRTFVTVIALTVREYRS